MHIHFADQPGLSACQGSSGQSPALQRDAQSAARRCSAAPDPAAGVPLCRWKHGVRSALNAFSMFNKTGAVRDGEVVWRLDEASLQQEQEAQAAVSSPAVGSRAGGCPTLCPRPLITPCSLP